MIKNLSTNGLVNTNSSHINKCGEINSRSFSYQKLEKEIRKKEIKKIPNDNRWMIDAYVLEYKLKYRETFNYDEFFFLNHITCKYFKKELQ